MNEDIIEKNQDIDKNIKIKIPKELLALNKLFEDAGFELFIVGGYLRDTILNIATEDIDICSKATPEEVEKLLKGTSFLCTIINKRLGTYKIYTRSSNVNFEYTTFRKENYDYGHSPSYVEFVDDIAVDASRRDFSVNCIYYSLKTKQFFDPYKGVNACKKHLLTIINNEVFDSDGLRIMRMLRLAYTKNLTIAKSTYNKAQCQTHLLTEISHERIAKEMREIIKFHTSHKAFKGKINFSAFDFVESLINLKLLNYIFPQLQNYIDLDLFYENVELGDDIHNLTAYDLIIAIVYMIVTTIENVTRMEVPSTLYIDLLGLNGLMLPRQTTLKYRVLIDGLVTLNKMYDKSLYINYVQLFYPFLDDIIASRIFVTGGGQDEQLVRLITTDKLMKANGIPRSFEELNLKPMDIIKKFPNLPQNQIGSMLEYALLVATQMRNNDKEFLLNELAKVIKGGQPNNDK